MRQNNPKVCWRAASYRLYPYVFYQYHTRIYICAYVSGRCRQRRPFGPTSRMGQRYNQRYYINILLCALGSVQYPITSFRIIEVPTSRIRRQERSISTDAMPSDKCLGNPREHARAVQKCTRSLARRAHWISVWPFWRIRMHAMLHKT